MFSKNLHSGSTFDITDVSYIERIVVGAVTPDQIPSEDDVSKSMAQVNRCLSEYPKGKIIGIERSFSVIHIGEHQVVLEAIIYHIGFNKRPLWLEEKRNNEKSMRIDTSKLDSLIERQ